MSVSKLEFHNIDDRELTERIAVLLRRGFGCQTFQRELKPSEFRIMAREEGKYTLEFACVTERKLP